MTEHDVGAHYDAALPLQDDSNNRNITDFQEVLEEDADTQS